VASENKADYIWIIPSKDANNFGLELKLARKLKEKAPGAKIIVDMAYFYSQNFLTNGELPKTERAVSVGQQFVETMVKLLELASRIVVSNKNEKLHHEEMFNRNQKIYVVPYVYKIIDLGLPLERRRNICVFGTNDSNYHADDSRYSQDVVLDSIRVSNSSFKYRLISDDLCAAKDMPKSVCFKTVATRKHLPTILLNYKLCLFPIGCTKSAIDMFGMAAAAGVPIVASEIAAEGYPVRDGNECFIAKSPLEFEEKCNQCLSDPIAWNNFRTKSQIMIAENFSPQIISVRLQKIFIN
jgi:glycosyltransferase involved in cell wall biosynthesis